GACSRPEAPTPPPRRRAEARRAPARRRRSVLARLERNAAAFLRDVREQRGQAGMARRQILALERVADAPVDHFPHLRDAPELLLELRVRLGMRVRRVRMTLRARDAVRAELGARPQIPPFLRDALELRRPALEIGFRELVRERRASRQGRQGRNQELSHRFVPINSAPEEEFSSRGSGTRCPRAGRLRRYTPPSGSCCRTACSASRRVQYARR